MIGYRPDPSLSIDVQRRIVKSLLEVYRTRGTDLSIMKAATYATSDRWVGGDLFVDKDAPEISASIFNPSHHLFTFGKSAWSGADRFRDRNYWREGVIDIFCPSVNSVVRSAVMETTPAGVRVYYSSLLECVLDATKEFGKINFNCSDRDSLIVSGCLVPLANRGFRWSTPLSDSLWSGVKLS